MALLAAGALVALYLLPIPGLTTAEVLGYVRQAYDRYGYWVVFLGAFIEGLFVISWYFPGSTIVVLGAVFAGAGLLSLPLVVALAVLGFVLSANVNYLLGRYGWYRVLERLGAGPALEQAKARVRDFGWRAIFLGFVNPALGVLMATAAGILRLPYAAYLGVTSAAVLFWMLVWGGLAYRLGPPLLDAIVGYGWVWTVPLVAWLVWKVIRS